MTLLQQIDSQRKQAREALRVETRQRLREELARHMRGSTVIVFGSLAKPCRFTEFSDIDIALEAEPDGLSIYQLSSLLAEALGRRVDVVLLSECRFRDKILREGEAWTLPD
jgi:predicted nucleotidyltransferase